MDDNQAEVGIRLKADDQASSVIDGMRDNADKAASGVGSLNAKLSGMAQTAVANFIGNTMIPKIFDYGDALVNNAMHVQEQTRKIGAYFVTQTGASWESAMSQADGVESALAGMAIKIGMSIDTARNAFSNLAASTDASSESMDGVLARTEQLMQISDITLVPVEAISAEYAMMEKGIVKTKGALTKLLFSTGIFGDNIKKAKAHWSALTAEQRKSSLDGAMAKLAGSMAKAPQSLGSLLESLGAVKQRIMDIAGKNLVANLTPRVEALLNFMERKRPQLSTLAAKFGDVLAQSGGEAIDWIGEKVDYFVLHWDDIINSIKDGAKKVYEVAKFIVDNADLIALAYGMKTVSPAIMAGIQNAGALKAMGGAMVKFTGLTIAANGGLTAFVAQLAIVAVSVGAATLAFAAAKGQWDRFQEEGGFTAAWQAMRYGGGYNDMDLKAVRESIEGAMQGNNLKGAAETIKNKRDAIEQMKGKARQEYGDAAPDHYSAMGITAMESLVEDFANRIPAMGNIAAADAIKTQSEMVAMYNQAILSNDQMMASYIASQAGNAEAMAYGLADNATKIEGGFDGFMGRLNDKTREFVAGLNTIYGAAHPNNVKPKKEVKPDGGLHLHGGQKFEIHQDFREADPDRIAIYMRRDFIKAATARVRSRVRTPFGV